VQKSPFAPILNDAIVRRLASAPRYARGLDFLAYGHVEHLRDSGTTIRGVVRALSRHAVELSADDGLLDYSCDCEAGRSGEFCIHCSAVALAWIEWSKGRKTRRGAAKPLTPAEAVAVLRDLDKDDIVRMVQAWVEDDAGIRDRLVVDASRCAGPQTGAAALAAAFKKAVSLRGYKNRRETAVWARGVNDIVNQIERTFEDGSPAAIIEVCESALELLALNGNKIDNTEDPVGILRDRLEDLHYRACLEAPPEPAALARRLLNLEVEGDFNIFNHAVQKYRALLGPAGVEAYKAAMNARWELENTPERVKSFDGLYRRRLHKLRTLMEDAALEEGPDALVALISRNLSEAHNYVRIAKVLRDAGRPDEAAVWLERGRKAFPKVHLPGF
jgi:hypothetical protein